MITTAMIQPIIDTINANVEVLVPVGIGVLGIMIGVQLIPRIVYKFL